MNMFFSADVLFVFHISVDFRRARPGRVESYAPRSAQQLVRFHPGGGDDLPGSRRVPGALQGGDDPKIVMLV